ncbi:MAG: hypothetical protein H7301_03040 [Cryobacterium sp.]|nr:hypothetical protein [Oligoflexia bacterium]
MISCFIFLLGFSAPALAGTPDQDPSVYLAQRMYERAISPSAEKLFAGKRWICGSFSASPGTLSGTNGADLGTFIFEANGEGFTNLNKGYPNSTVFNRTGRDLRSQYSFSPTAHGSISVREMNGALVAEVTAQRSRTDQVAAISVPTEVVSRYYYCTLYDSISSENAERVYSRPF